LVLGTSAASADRWDEIDQAEFRSWFGHASCNGFFSKYISIGRSLVVGEDQLREWQMEMRIQLKDLHDQYGRRCISKHRTWSSDCNSIRHAIRVIHNVLFEDEDRLIDHRTRQSTLRERRREIRAHYTEHCVLPDFEDEPAEPDLKPSLLDD
jgi:hypothetical protein